MTRRFRVVAVLAMALLALTARGGFAAAGSAARSEASPTSTAASRSNG